MLKFFEVWCEKSSEMKLEGLSDENFDMTMLRIMNVQEVQVRWKRDDKTKILALRLLPQPQKQSCLASKMANLYEYFKCLQSSKNMKGVVFECLNAHFSFQKNSGSTVQKQKKMSLQQQRITILFQDCPRLPQNLRFKSLCVEMLYLNGCFDITLLWFNIP